MPETQALDALTPDLIADLKAALSDWLRLSRAYQTGEEIGEGELSELTARTLALLQKGVVRR